MNYAYEYICSLLLITHLHVQRAVVQVVHGILAVYLHLQLESTVDIVLFVFTNLFVPVFETTAMDAKFYSSMKEKTINKVMPEYVNEVLSCLQVKKR